MSSAGNPRITFRVPEDEIARWEATASKQGYSIPDWLRVLAGDACAPKKTTRTTKVTRTTKPTKPENQLARATRIRREWEELLREHHSVAMSEFGSLEEYERRQK